MEAPQLAYGYFRGGDRLKHQIEEGNLSWTLRQMRKSEPVCQAEEGLSEGLRTLRHPSKSLQNRYFLASSLEVVFFLQIGDTLSQAGTEIMRHSKPYRLYLRQNLGYYFYKVPALRAGSSRGSDWPVPRDCWRAV
jgi:hypothetical protein